MTRFSKIASVLVFGCVLIALFLVQGVAQSGSQRRTRLYLKDGSYQAVLSYEVRGDVVVYRSAERAGAQEEIPLSLVDMAKTRAAQGEGASPPVLSPELQQQEQERAARTPEVAPGLNLPEQDDVVALDVFKGAPELMPLSQTEGDLNRQTAHNMVRQAINPFAHAHQLVEIKGAQSSTVLHALKPVFYVHVEAPANASSDDVPQDAFQVDTHGALTTAARDAAHGSRYAIVKVQPRGDVRVVYSFQMDLFGHGEAQDDAVPVTETLLPGGHWKKLTPVTTLPPGEYALLEVISEREINQSVWDFAVRPEAGESRGAIKPTVRRRPELESR